MNKAIFILLLIVFIDGVFKKQPLMELFMDGIKDALSLIKPLFMTLMAFMLFVEMMRTCGVIDVISVLLSPVFTWLQLPADIFLLAILRPISANASLSFLYTIFERFGVDHPVSLLASLIQCGSDTTLYVITLYFSSLKISNTRYALLIGLFMDFLCIVFAIVIYIKMFV